MGKWNTRESLALVDRALVAIRENGRLEPGMGVPGDPVDLRGLSFPTVALTGRVKSPPEADLSRA